MSEGDCNVSNLNVLPNECPFRRFGAFVAGGPTPRPQWYSANSARVICAGGVAGARRVPVLAPLWSTSSCARLSLRASSDGHGGEGGGAKPQVLVGGVPADLDDKSLREAFEKSEDDSQVTGRDSETLAFLEIQKRLSISN